LGVNHLKSKQQQPFFRGIPSINLIAQLQAEANFQAAPSIRGRAAP
jgi:hypothetical protein